MCLGLAVRNKPFALLTLIKRTGCWWSTSLSFVI